MLFIFYLFQFVSSSQKQMIINAYKMELTNNPKISIRECRIILSKRLGIGQRTISNTISEYNTSKTVLSPNRKRCKKSFQDAFDDLHRNTVRRHVHSFWYNKTIPTLAKIYRVVKDDDSLPDISQTNLYRLLKSMNFEYTKRSRNSALVEKDEIVAWRSRYLEDIQKYREEGRHLYYLDETWVNAGECTNKTWVDNTVKSCRDAFVRGLTTGAKNPTGKGKRLIILHIGSEDGFVPGGLLCFESKKNTNDYHDEMNGDTFFEWMQSILPRLKENCVIIMDNASYHSVKADKIPSTSTRKADIIKWLEEKGQVIDKPMIIPRLLDMVRRIRPMDEKYVIDELAKEHNRTILRLPPYHCELNPIELAWSSVKHHVKINNTSYKLSDVKNLLLDGIERVDAIMWKNFINHTKKIEKEFYDIDFIVDHILSAEVEPVVMDLSNSSSESESDQDIVCL